MRRAIPPLRLWAVTAVDGEYVLGWTISGTRTGAIKASLTPDEKPDGEWRKAWKEWRGLGCRAVKVTVTVDEQP